MMQIRRAAAAFGRLAEEAARAGHGSDAAQVEAAIAAAVRALRADERALAGEALIAAAADDGRPLPRRAAVLALLHRMLAAAESAPAAAEPAA